MATKAQKAKPAKPRTMRAVVVGMAVMDTIFRIPKMPESEQSVQVDSFSLHPGGKALVQAVAAARLGMQVALVACLGSDAFAVAIESYLKREGVQTALLKKAHPDVVNPSLHGNTPVTGVVQYRTGKSIALGWKNEADATVRLAPSDIRRPEIVAALEGADVVFVTFEVPAPTVVAAIAVAARVRPRPLIVVTPAPPYEGVPLGRESLGQIDYLVAQEWEVEKLQTERETEPTDAPSKEELAQYIRRDGVGCVCIVDTSGSLVQSKGMLLKTPSYILNPRDTAGARDAFAVALMAKVLEAGKLEKAAVHWAAAAWAAAASTRCDGVPQGMPTREAIDAMLESVPTQFPSDD